MLKKAILGAMCCMLLSLAGAVGAQYYSDHRMECLWAWCVFFSLVTGVSSVFVPCIIFDQGQGQC